MMNDDETLLLVEIRNGKREAFTRLYNAYEKLVYFLIRKNQLERRGQNRSELPEYIVPDVVQEIFFKLFKSLLQKNFAPECKVSTWLGYITNSVLADYGRAQNKQKGLVTNWKWSEPADSQEESQAVNVQPEAVDNKDDSQIEIPAVDPELPAAEDRPEDFSEPTLAPSSESLSKEEKKHFEKTLAKQYWRVFDDDEEEKFWQALEDFEKQRCVERVFTLLQRDRSKVSVLKCLEALMWRAQGDSVEEIMAKIGRTYEATRKYLSECGKKLREYGPIRQCWEEHRR